MPFIMDTGPVMHLIEALREHPYLGQDLDRKYFFDLLNSIKIKPSRRFYKKIENNVYPLGTSDSNRNSVFSIDLILRNQVAEEYKKWGYKANILKRRRVRRVASRGIYDHVVLSRKLRADQKILEMMANATIHGALYSVLGRVETFDESTTKFERRPLIVIPMADRNVPRPEADISRLVEWETANTQYGLKNASGRITSLTREEYLRI